MYLKTNKTLVRFVAWPWHDLFAACSSGVSGGSSRCVRVHCLQSQNLKKTKEQEKKKYLGAKQQHCHIPYFIKSTSDVFQCFQCFQCFSHPFQTPQSHSTPTSLSYSTPPSLSYSTPSIPYTAIPLHPFWTLLFHSGNPIPTPTYCLLDFCFCPFLHFCPFLCFYPFLLFCLYSHLPTVSFVMPVLLSHFLFQFRTCPYLFCI